MTVPSVSSIIVLTSVGARLVSGVHEAAWDDTDHPSVQASAHADAAAFIAHGS
ncbi:hypothetical protein [Burkholderia sp.]|uniref:hypothetical protein n=1 Tax=Burkholderia sp. TaxID=36773 RepID=UPI0025C10285|nr:hypothetical protein [Burkholderia sp.]